MKFRFQYIYALFMLSFGILTVLSVLFYQKLMKSTRASNAVEHNYETMFLLSQVDSHLKDAINSEHTFLMSRDTSVLGPAFRNPAKIAALFDSIRQMVRHQNGRQLNLVKLQTLVAERLNQLKDNVSKALLGLDEVNIAMRLRAAKVVMADYQQLYEKMLLSETRYKIDLDSQKQIDQRSTPNLLYATFIFAAACLILSFFFIIRELRKRLEFQQQLQQQLGVLNRANAELEQLTNIASHHLQEPLRKIQTFSNQITTRYNDLPEEVNRLLEKMDIAAKHMHGLTRDMVKYSNLINTQDALMQVDLNYVLMKVAEQMDEKLTLKQGQLTITNTLPVVKGIPAQLAILFEQLIDNSIKFSRKDIPPVITITNEQITGGKISNKIQSAFGLTLYYKISVSDNGMGFDNKYVDKMFYLFQKLDSQQAFYQSKGIGLPMVQRIMINHGGNVVAMGTAGEGATFHLFFPVPE
jgi:signal transduction histidine kinase